MRDARAKEDDVERLLTTQELADLVGVPKATVYRWAHQGEGPVGIRIGKHRRYRLSDIEAWLEQQADRRQPA